MDYVQENTNNSKLVEGWNNKIFFLLWITYASFYLGRVNFSATIPGIMADFNFSRADLGIVTTTFFWCYAIGQFVNGQIGDRYGARLYITGGLFVSAVVNLIFGLSTSLLVMAMIWGINGYFQSTGWPLIVKTMAHWFPPRLHGRASGFLGTSYILGSALSVILAGFVVKNFSWKAGFIIPGILIIISGIHWNIRAKNSPDESRICNTNTCYKENNNHRFHYTFGKTFGCINVWILGIGLFFVNIIRYGFMMWAPTYLVETQNTAIDVAAYTSAILPIFGSLGAITAGWISDEVFQSKRAPVACIFMIFAGVLAWLYRFEVSLAPWSTSLCVLGAIGFFLFGAHVMIVAAAPVDYGTKHAASSTTGFIDGWGYIGAGLEGIGTGMLVDAFGWNGGFYFWIVSAFIAAGIMGFLWFKNMQIQVVENDKHVI